jgi:hypothetical protein
MVWVAEPLNYQPHLMRTMHGSKAPFTLGLLQSVVVDTVMPPDD